MSKASSSVLGIDLVGTAFRRYQSRFIADPHSFRWIQKLVQNFRGEVHCISTVANSREESVLWDTTTAFFRATGIPDTHIHFCRPYDPSEGGSDKNVRCANHRVTHFVDANVPSLCSLSFVRRLFLLDLEGKRRGITLPDSVVVAASWENLMRVCVPREGR